MPRLRNRRLKPVGRRSGRERDWTWTWEPVAPVRPPWRRWLWAPLLLAAVAVAVAFVLAFAVGGLGGGPAEEEKAVAPYAAVGGSVAVALGDGRAADAAIFENKCDAYLVTGREAMAPLLPDGHYFFQVTDVSGRALLSSDAVKFRQFRVVDGVIEGVSGQGRHTLGRDTLKGGASVSLCPFADSPDSSGLYQVWVTTIQDFRGDVEGVDSAAPDFHGFLVSRSAKAVFAVSPAR